MAVVFALSVSSNLLNSYFFLQRRVKPSVIAAACIGVVGLGLIFWPDIRQTEYGSDLSIGFALSLVATLSFSFGNTFSAKI
ncbi:MAG: hypothetical protein H7240_02025 [Glaciimonas sp.]|nr:hypothetical protein [Glaciimonas sp.]